MNDLRNSRDDTNFLRCIAILLVINSHMGLYYPVKHIATGGAIGDALFCMVSSFGLLLSQRKNPKKFSEWYAGRIRRIYPAVWATILLIKIPILIYQDAVDINKIMGLMGDFFYPPHWFLQALMIFYFLSYFLIKRYTSRKIFITFGVFSISYFLIYFSYLDLTRTLWIEDLPFKLLFYFLIFLFGIILADNNAKIRYAGKEDFIFLFLSLMAIYGHKFLMTKGIFSNFQFIQQVLLFAVVFYSLKISRSDFVQVCVMQSYISKIVNYISNITLELYIIHPIVSHIIVKSSFTFPINILLLLVISFLLASLVNTISNKMLLLSKV